VSEEAQNRGKEEEKGRNGGMCSEVVECRRTCSRAGLVSVWGLAHTGLGRGRGRAAQIVRILSVVDKVVSRVRCRCWTHSRGGTRLPSLPPSITASRNLDGSGAAPGTGFPI